MEEWLIALVVTVSVLSSVCTIFLVPLRQLFSKVDPRFFKRVKVKFPSFLFVGIGGRKSETGNVRTFGVIVPMFVLHIVGYLLTLAMWVTIPFAWQYGMDLTELWAIPVAFAFLHTVLTVVTEAVCLKISRKRAAEEQVETQA